MRTWLRKRLGCRTGSGLLTQIHPALERVVGPRLATRQGLAVIEQLGGPQGMTAASKSKLLRVVTKANPRHAQNFADAITQALSEQTVVVAGTAADEQVLPKLAASLPQTWTSAASWLRRSRRSLMLTLLPRS